MAVVRHAYKRPTDKDPRGVMCDAQGDDLMMTVYPDRVNCPACLRLMKAASAGERPGRARVWRN